MQGKRLTLGLLSLVLTGAIGLAPVAAESPQFPTAALLPAPLVTKTTLTLAKVSNEPRKHIPGLTEVGRYLVNHLKDLGISRERVILARDNEQMLELLRAGEVDLVMETPFSAFVFEERAGAEILLREWRDGVPAYHTVFFARRDGPVRSLSDLRGRTIAFEDPGSTSAYHVPVLSLRRHGIPVVAASAAGGQRPRDAVSYVFARDELNIVAWVARGRADAGVLSNLDWSRPEKAPPPLRRQLRIFHQTADVIRSVVLVRGGIPAPLKARLKQLLTAMDDTAEGRAALALLGVSKYDEIVGRTAEDLDNARRLYNEAR